MQESERVGLVDHVSVMPRDDVILVNGAFGDPGNKFLPNARTLTRAQGMRILVPVIEAAHHGYGAGIGRPHAEAGAGPTVDRSKMRAQLFVGAVMPPLIEKIKILLSQKSHFSARPRAMLDSSLWIRVS